MSYKKLTAIAVSLAVCIAAVCIVTGCGEGSSASSTSSGTSGKAAPLSKAQLIAAADPICAHYLTELHAHPFKKASEFTKTLQLLSSYHQAELSGLKKLTPPSALAADWTKIVGGHEAIGRDMAQGLRDAHTGDLHAVTTLVAIGSRQQAATVSIARRDGFKDCSRIR